MSEAAPMSTTEHLETGHHDTGHRAGHSDAGEHGEHKSDGYYVVVALILAVITALETSTYWIDFGPIFMPLLLILMTIKFVMVVSLFMHLKFDHPLFSYLFYSGLILALGVYLAALATFRFFGSG
jgi:cytochrome c oxidase subunit 4